MRTLTALVAVLTLVGGATTAASATGHEPFPPEIDLSPGFFPEGVALGRGSTFYVGSLADGSVHRGDLRTGDVQLLADGPGPFTTVGLDVDEWNRVWVAGGPSGTGRVYDGSTGALLAAYEFTDPFASFVNDVIVTDGAAWFTDSGTQNSPDPSQFVFAGEPRLFRVPVGPDGQLADAADVEELDVVGTNGDLDVTFPNFNGIETAPGTDELVVAHTSLGALLRVDPSTGEAAEVYSGDLVGADGLVRRGNAIHVVENGAGEISEVRIDPSSGTGTLAAVRPVTGAETPTTAAIFGDALYTVDARFGSMTGPYRVYRVPLH